MKHPHVNTCFWYSSQNRIITKQMKQKPNLSLFIALIPVATLVLLLSLNVLIYGNEALNGSNQFILLMGGAVAAIIGFSKKTSYNEMLNNIEDNIKSVTENVSALTTKS